MIRRLVAWLMRLGGEHSDKAATVIARLNVIDAKQLEFGVDLEQVKEKTDTIYAMFSEMREAPRGWTAPERKDH